MVDEASPDKLFDRSWAVELADKARDRLGLTYTARGQRDLFLALRDFMSWDKGVAAYGETAKRLGLTETNLRSHVFRMRQRFRKALEEEIAETVTNAAQAAEELKHLVEILRE